MMAVTPPEVSGVQYAAFLNPLAQNVRVIPMTDPVPAGWIMLLNGAHVESLGIDIDVSGEPLKDLVERLDLSHKFIFKTGSDPSKLEPADDPFAAPVAAPVAATPTALKSFGEVRTELPEGYVIDIVRRGDRFSSEWGRYGDPASDIPDTLEIPQVPGSKLVDELVKVSDPHEVWWIFLKAQKPSAGDVDLDELTDADPKPLEDQGPDYGKFGQADQANRIISRRVGGGERKPNFGFYPASAPLRKGWEPVIDPKSLHADVQNAQVVIDGSAEKFSVLLDGIGQKLSVAHAEDTSWNSFEEDQSKAKWPPFEEKKESAPPGGKLGSWVSGNPKLAFFLAVAVAVLIWAFGGTLGVLVDIVVFASLAAAVLAYSVTHRGFASEAAWFGLGVGGLFTLWWWVYDHKAREATIAAAFAHGLAWGFAVMIVAFVTALAVSRGQPIFTEENFERFRWFVIGILGVAVLLLVALVLTHNTGVTDNGQTENRCGPNGTEPNSIWCQQSITTP